MEMEKVGSVSEAVSRDEKKEVSLDQALDIVGIGWYNLKYGLVLAFFLMSSIIEVVGYSYVLPAAKCDLNMTDSQRGLISSLPYVAIVLTSFPWGYLVDTRGRKRMVILSSTLAGIFGVVAAFAPELISFTVFKFIASIAMTCPSSVPYPFIGEILPQRHRDIALSITNALQMMGAALVPLLAWGILPLDIRVDFGAYEFRSWRLLCIAHSSTFLISAFFMSFGLESPKYLTSQGKHDEALDVLRKMYAMNTGKSPNDFPVHKIMMPPTTSDRSGNFLSLLKPQIVPLVKAPFAKWMCLNGVLLFGIFSSLNGLFIWVPDILNRALSGNTGGNMTTCQIIRQRLDAVVDENAVCTDTIDNLTFQINFVANMACAIITLAISSTIKIVGKKKIIILMYIIIGALCISVNFIRIALLFAVILCSLQLLALGIGPINAFAVDIFPTNLRGMAVSLTMSLGRIGSVLGANIAGILINSQCETTFYLFGGLLIVCAFLSLLLPAQKKF